MKRVLMAVLAVAVLASPAFAQDKKAAGKAADKTGTAAGTVSKVSGTELTVKGKDAEWTFVVDKDTTVTAKGASTKTAANKADAKPNPITEFVHEGDTVSVKYHDGATKHASAVTVTAKATAKK